MPAWPPVVKARRMEDARRSVWLPSRPAIEPDTLVATGPRLARNSSDKDLLKIKKRIRKNASIFLGKMYF